MIKNNLPIYFLRVLIIILLFNNFCPKQNIIIVQNIMYFIYQMIIKKLIHFVKYENQSLERPTNKI